MRVRQLSFIIALVQLAALSLAVPITPNTDTGELSSLIPRSQFCTNAPVTKAGTPFTRRDLASSLFGRSLAPRANNDGVIWCARGSQTYIVLTVGWQAGSGPLLTLLNQAYDLTVSHIGQVGDGLLYPLPTGRIGSVFNLESPAGLVLNIANANNHQTTWGVLGAALWALKDFVTERGGFTTATFQIFDGVNQVASGTLGQ